MPEAFLDKLVPSIDFRDRPANQWDIPVVTNTFVYRWLKMNNINDT